MELLCSEGDGEGSFSNEEVFQSFALLESTQTQDIE